MIMIYKFNLDEIPVTKKINKYKISNFLFCSLAFMMQCNSILNMLFAIKIHKKIIFFWCNIFNYLLPMLKKNFHLHSASHFYRLFFLLSFTFNVCNITHCGILSSSPAMSLVVVSFLSCVIFMILFGYYYCYIIF